MHLFQWLRHFIGSRLWVQVWLGLGVFVGLILSSLGLLLIHTSKEGVRTTLLRDQEEIAIRAAEEIALYVEQPVKMLETAAALMGISHTDVWKQETLLVELGLGHPLFSRISSVSLTGEELASSLPASEKKSFSQDPFLKNASEGKINYSDILISKEGMPYMRVAVPYRSLGKVQGVLMADVLLRGFWEIVDTIQIGKTGFAYVVDSQGLVLAHRDKKWVLKNLNLSHLEPVKKGLQGKKGSQVLVNNINHRRVLTGYAPVGFNGWALITEQDWSEAFSFAHIMTSQSQAFVVIGIILSFLLCVTLAIGISRPIRKMTHLTRQVAEGNFDISISSKRKDEIGRLLQNFAHMARQLKKAKEMERLTSMGMAAAGIAHELRNPLVAIKTYTQLFSRRKEDPQFLDRFEKTIPPEIDRLSHMLNELNDFSKVNSVTLTPISLSLVVEETYLLMKERAANNGVELKYISQPLELETTVLGDKEKIKQVLINLITNALEAMEQRGKIRLEIQKGSDNIQVVVADTGKGIPAEELSIIFEPFQSIRKKGLGLGLTICRNIMAQHQGCLNVSSIVNQGTTFTLQFPLPLPVKA